LSYAQRLCKLKTESLEERRLKIDLQMIFKIVHKIVDINENLFQCSAGSLTLRGHNSKFLKPHTTLNCRAHSFACRNIKIWNDLPQEALVQKFLEKNK
jgi:hypothetical protein